MTNSYINILRMSTTQSSSNSHAFGLVRDISAIRMKSCADDFRCSPSAIHNARSSTVQIKIQLFTWLCVR